MSFDTLTPQIQANAAAESYSAECLRQSRNAVDQVPAILDLPYGPLAEQRLDIWHPRNANGLPVLIFFHGGNFTHGYKEWCGFMAETLTTLPAILVAAEYRLSPTAPYREIIGDGFAALRWVRDHIMEFGGNPGRVFLAGHSAGAQMVAEIALRHERRAAAGLADDAFVAVLPISGNFHRRLGSIEPDPADRIADDIPDSPVELAAGARHPFLVTWGGAEKPYVHEAGKDFTRALKHAGIEVTQLVIPDRDHFAVHLDMGRRENAWVKALAGMMGAGR